MLFLALFKILKWQRLDTQFLPFILLTAFSTILVLYIIAENYPLDLKLSYLASQEEKWKGFWMSTYALWRKSATLTHWSSEIDAQQCPHLPCLLLCLEMILKITMDSLSVKQAQLDSISYHYHQNWSIVPMLGPKLLSSTFLVLHMVSRKV